MLERKAVADPGKGQRNNSRRRRAGQEASQPDAVQRSRERGCRREYAGRDRGQRGYAILARAVADRSPHELQQPVADSEGRDDD